MSVKIKHYRTQYVHNCLSDPLRITTSFVSRPYLFLPSVFPCIRPLYNDRVLWVKIFHITTIEDYYQTGS